jgi:hypothetical protein
MKSWYTGWHRVIQLTKEEAIDCAVMCFHEDSASSFPPDGEAGRFQSVGLVRSAGGCMLPSVLFCIGCMLPSILFCPEEFFRVLSDFIQAGMLWSSWR